MQFSWDPTLYPPPLIPTGHLLPSIQVPGPVPCRGDWTGSCFGSAAWGAVELPGELTRGWPGSGGSARSGCPVKRTVGGKRRVLVHSLGPFSPPYTPRLCASLRSHQCLWQAELGVGRLPVLAELRGNLQTNGMRSAGIWETSPQRRALLHSLLLESAGPPPDVWAPIPSPRPPLPRGTCAPPFRPLPQAGRSWEAPGVGGGGPRPLLVTLEKPLLRLG